MSLTRTLADSMTIVVPAIALAAAGFLLAYHALRVHLELVREKLTGARTRGAPHEP
jgi:hypothetical protein